MKQPSGLQGEREHALEQRELPVDLGIGDVADALVRAVVDHPFALAVGNEGAYVCRGDVGHPAPHKERCQVLRDTTIDHNE